MSKEKTIISNIVFDSGHTDFFYRESVKQQIETIKNLLQLDFDILFCAHNPQMKDGKKKLETKLRFFENFYEEVATLHKKKLSPAQILRKMELKEFWFLKIWSGGHLSVINMVNAVIRDEREYIS